jgi:hypothetical protein
MDREPVTGLSSSLDNNGPKRGRKSTPQTRRRHKVDVRRQRDQIRVCVSNLHKFRKSSPLSKSRLRVLIANMLISGLTLLAGTAATTKRDRDSLTD